MSIMVSIVLSMLLTASSKGRCIPSSKEQLSFCHHLLYEIDIFRDAATPYSLCRSIYLERSWSALKLYGSMISEAEVLSTNFHP
ncbi:hypothetical protein F4604DRAFT_567577 [Suillus subluteus]|nr:hypothetical protein F4604DRAFT_567577 [Suillus subluteus]